MVDIVRASATFSTMLQLATAIEALLDDDSGLVVVRAKVTRGSELPKLSFWSSDLPSLTYHFFNGRIASTIRHRLDTRTFFSMYDFWVASM